MDITYLGLVAVFWLLIWGLARGCDRIGHQEVER